MEALPGVRSEDEGGGTTMTTNNRGLVSASKDELMAIWLFDDDLFRLFDFSKFVLWCKITGVKVSG